MNEFAEKHIKRAGEDFLGFPRFASAHCISYQTIPFKIYFSQSNFLWCLFQLKREKDALDAAFTYFIRNEEDEHAKSNVEYYLEETGVALENVKNIEAYVSFKHDF